MVTHYLISDVIEHDQLGFTGLVKDQVQFRPLEDAGFHHDVTDHDGVDAFAKLGVYLVTQMEVRGDDFNRVSVGWEVEGGL
jgi:hypothetical protein